MTRGAHPLGKILLHPDDEASELKLIGGETLGSDYLLTEAVVPRPKKNILMTEEWLVYFRRYRMPVKHAENVLIAEVTKVTLTEVGRFYAPWRDRRREKFTPANVVTRATIQAHKIQLHGRGYAVFPPPDPWELATPVHTTRADTIALDRLAREGVLEEDEAAKKREGRGLLMMTKLAKMRENACKSCGGTGGKVDENGDVLSPCGVCGGRGMR